MDALLSALLAGLIALRVIFLFGFLMLIVEKTASQPNADGSSEARVTRQDIVFF